MDCGSCGYANPEEALRCGRCGAAPTGITSPDLHGDGSPLPTPTFATGRYQVRTFLGEGSRKRVYLAHDSRLDRDVAIAVLKTAGLDEAGMARVEREARELGRLGEHPHIATVYDFAEEDGEPYLVSEYMEGGSLARQLARAEGGRLPVAQAVVIADQLCQALTHAHERGILHRDLKPSNVWVTQNGAAKLGDFGLMVSIDRARFARDGILVGTAAYIAPEQIMGPRAAARSDLYSLGALLYEMVTGRPPFLGDDLLSVLSQHINAPPVAPSLLNAEVPPLLDALIRRLLSKAPAERPESAAAVREALSAMATTPAPHASLDPVDVGSPLERLGSGAFVGREQEMDVLRVGLEEAIWGRGRLVLVVGEPGIGKTRLAQELATYASLRGALVLTGRCHEGEGAPPYWPWTQALRSLISEREPAALQAEMGPGAAAIAQVIPEVRERLPGVHEPPPLGPESARFRFFDGVTEFLKRAGNRQPLALVLDDLHWADLPSLRLLVFLARELREARLLVIGTLRDAEATDDGSLRWALAELTREATVQRITLGGLSQREIARFIALTTNRKPSDAIAASVHEETQGNPFYLGEVVRLLVSQRRDGSLEGSGSSRFEIPHGLRPVIGRRLDQLSARSRDVLATASVVGRQFRLDVIARVTGLGRDHVIEMLGEAKAARVVHDLPETLSHYAFTHALVCETLYEGLPALHRMRLHGRVAEALEELSVGEADLPGLAHHFLQAAPLGHVEKAIDYAVRAGVQATAVLAYEVAASHYRMALQALDLVPPREAQRCELLLALGEALRRAGDAQHARESFRRAAEIARRLRAPEWLARAALGYGGMWSEVGVVDEALVGLLREALASLEDGEGALRVRLRSRLALELYLDDEGDRLSREAVQTARRIGEPAGLLSALHSRHATLLRPESLAERLAVASEIVRLAGEVGDAEFALQGHYWRLTDLLELGELGAVDEDLQAYGRLADTLRQPLYLSRTAFRGAMRALLEGRFEEAERLTERGLALGQRAQNQTTALLFGIQLWSLRREQGRLREVEAALRSVIAQFPMLPAWRCALLYLQVELGRTEEARAGFEALAADRFAALPRDAFWLVGMTLLAEVCAVMTDVSRAATLYEALRPFSERHVVVGRAAAAYYGAVARPLGLLAATMSRWDAALEHFEAALTMHARIGARPWLAHSQHDYAAMLLARGRADDRRRALELLDLALATAQELGMTKLRERAESLRAEVKQVVPVTSGRRPGRDVANVFRRETDYWTVGYEGRVIRLKDSKGLRYIAHLLRYCGQTLHVGEVLAAGETRGGEIPADSSSNGLVERGLRVARPSGTGAALDVRARVAYQTRLAELQVDLAEAEKWRDPERASRLREEMDSLAHELATAYGLGGRARRTNDPVERARKAVANRIRDSVARIKAAHPALGQHLGNAIKTGTLCAYTPDRTTPWQF